MVSHPEPSWISPYKPDEIAELVDKVFVFRDRATRQFFWHSFRWGKEQVGNYSSLIPSIVPVESINKAANKHQARHLAKFIAAKLLKWRFDEERIFHLTPRKVQDYCNELFGVRSISKDVDYLTLLSLVNSILEGVAIEHPGLKRIIQVRRTVLKRIADEAVDPTPTSRRWIQILEDTRYEYRRWHKKLYPIKTELNIIEVLYKLGIQQDFIERKRAYLFDRTEELANECLSDLCNWTKNNLTALNSVRITANFSIQSSSDLKKLWEDNGGTDDRDYQAAKKIWKDENNQNNRYIRDADDYLIMLWSTVPEYKNLWRPVVNDSPLPGAPLSYAKWRPCAVYVDDLESQWPFDEKWPHEEMRSMREQLEHFFEKQPFRMSLSFPVWQPWADNCPPHGIVNITLSEVDYSYYDRGRCLATGAILQQLLDFFGELLEVFAGIVLFHDKDIHKSSIDGWMDNYLTHSNQFLNQGDLIDNDKDNEKNENE